MMGWFVRNSCRDGLLRLNLSKRGAGASVGVTGARLGMEGTATPCAAGGRSGVRVRERPGPRRTHEASGGPGASGEGQASSRRGRRWPALAVLALAIGITFAVMPAWAAESTRVELFDARGRRTGYAVVDRATGRVDFYDAMSRRTGYGRVDGAGKVERFGLDGKRQGETALPVQPKRDRSR